MNQFRQSKATICLSLAFEAAKVVVNDQQKFLEMDGHSGRLISKGMIVLDFLRARHLTGNFRCVAQGDRMP